MEPVGLEPTTSALQEQRSPNDELRPRNCWRPPHGPAALGLLARERGRGNSARTPDTADVVRNWLRKRRSHPRLWLMRPSWDYLQSIPQENYNRNWSPKEDSNFQPQSYQDCALSHLSYSGMEVRVGIEPTIFGIQIRRIASNACRPNLLVHGGQAEPRTPVSPLPKVRFSR